MRRIYGFILLLALAPALPAFSQQRWERTYGGASSEEGRSVQQTSDGGYIIAGFTWSFGPGAPNYPNVYLIKTDASGDTLWTRTYGGETGDIGLSVQRTFDGGFIIVGGTTSFGAGSEDVYLIKTNASGDTVWTRTYGGTIDDEGFSVQQTSDSGYIIVGSTYSFGAGSYDVYLIKTDTRGDTVWTRTYGRANADWGYSVRQTSDGGYIITGETCSFGDSLGDVYVIKTNASGDTLWTRTYGGPYYDLGNSGQQTSDGGYIITGWKSFGYGAGGFDVYLIKMDASGNALWTKTYGGRFNDAGLSVQQTSDGSYIIAGYTYSFGDTLHGDVYLIKTNMSGDTLWTRTYGGTGGDWGLSVQQTYDGGYIISGETNSLGAGRYDVYLIKTDSLGRSSGVEEKGPELMVKGQGYKVTPNPFTSFATLPGHEAERFSLYDVSGRRVGIFRGDRIGEGLSPGVYFLRYQEMLKQVQHDEIVRIVKVR